jgi:tetratricopeptide (TPR) repeat protein
MKTEPSKLQDRSQPDIEFAHLVKRLKRLPEMDPPAGLTARIMHAIPPRRLTRWERVRAWISRPRTITITPAKWVPVGAALALGIIIGVGLNRVPVGTETLPPQVAADAESHYRQGRELLAANRAEDALAHFRQAADTQPDQARYQFWLGVSYWQLDDFDQERAHYLAALAQDPDFLPAHVYIGHNYLDQGDYDAARKHYRRVLQTVPDHADALFNLGVALNRLGEIEKENAAWRAYLNRYDRGPSALQAVAALNANGDFTYRRVTLGPLNLVKPRVAFEDDHTRLKPDAQAALDDIAQVMNHNHQLELHILVYMVDDAQTAALRANAIKTYLLERHADLAPRRIKLSWFGVAEKVRLRGRSFALDESVHLFAAMTRAS